MKIKIKVNSKHIKNGTSDTDSCPIALALMDNGYKDVSVDTDSIEFTTKRGNSLKLVPYAKVKKFINTFDDKGKVIPQTFEFLV